MIDLEEAQMAQELPHRNEGSEPFASAGRASKTPMLITNPRQAGNPIVFANDAFLKLTSFDRAEIIGRNCRFLQGPETNPDDVKRLDAAIAARTSIELELLNYRKDRTTFWNRIFVSPVFGSDGELTYWVASQCDVTLERERVARLEQDRSALETAVVRHVAELQASEQRLRLALQAGRLGAWVRDLETGHMIMSDSCKEYYGRPRDAAFTYEEMLASVHPDDRERRDAALAAAIANDTPYDIEYRILTPSGEERWLNVRAQTNYGADGTPVSFIGVTQDVTDRRRADDHRALLTHELSHRVKNSLAMVQAVVNQTLRRASSLEEADETLSARIQALSTANDLLINGGWETASMRALLDRTLAPFGIAEGTTFHLEGPDIRLSPRIAVALSLSLHELATNASKYGALSRPGGCVRLHWSVEDERRPRDLRFTWTETGGPPVVQPTQSGFGTKLIQRLLALEAGGNADIAYRAEGIVFTAVTPLADRNREDDAGGAGSDLAGAQAR